MKTSKESFEEQNEPSSNLDGTNSVENGGDNKPEPKKKKASKMPLYMAIILILTGLVLYFSLKDNFFEIIDTMRNIDVKNMIFGISCFVGSFLLDCLVIYLFARRYKKKYYFHQAAANTMIGSFYNALTPSQSGGQIVQAYTFKKQGISISNATSCLVMDFIVYQFVLILYGAFALIAKFSDLMSIDPIILEVSGVKILTIPIWLLTVLGFVLDISIIGLTILMSYSKHFHKFILNQGVNLFAKMRIVKNPDETRRKLSVQVESFKLELKNLFSNPIFLFLILLIHLGSLTLKFMVPYYIGIAVLGAGADASQFSYSLFDTVVFSSFQKIIVEIIPIPGDAGFAEYFFYQLFVPAYKDVSEANANIYLNSLQIIWRTITYHAPLIINAFVTAFYRTRAKEEFSSISSTTYVDLQSETIAERRTNYETMYATKMLNRQEYENKHKGVFSSILKRKNDSKDKDEDKKDDKK